MLHRLLRLPSPGFPEDMRTGDTRIDAYLEKLDSALAGSAGVRRHTLFEARDYLSEALERAGTNDADENAALCAAIDEFGQAEQVGGEQRRTCAAKFRGLAWRMGLFFATFMLIFSLLGLNAPTTWQLQAFIFIFNAVFYGSSMAFLMVYMLPKPMPTPQDTTAPGSFSAQYTRLGIRMAWGIVIVFGAMQIPMAWGLFGRGLFSDWPLSVLILLLVLNVKTILAAIDALFFRATVEADTLHLGGLGGRARIKRGQVVSIVAPRLLFQLFWPMYGSIRCLTWRDDAGTIRRRHVSLNRDLVHGDRLMAWLESAARENVVPATTSCLA